MARGKRGRDKLIFIAVSVVIVFGAVLFYMNTAPVLSATPSEGCMECHLNADVMEALYEVPPPAAGPG